MESRVIDAVISLPKNVFYGAPIPACLLILKRQRPPECQDSVLLVYAARHYRELSAQNELRPQDVMRMLVHYHAYGDSTKVPELITLYTDRIRKQIAQREEEEIGRLEAEYQEYANKLAQIDTEIALTQKAIADATKRSDKTRAEMALTKWKALQEKIAIKVTERDDRIAESNRRAIDDCNDMVAVGEELIALYNDPNELLKHARVVSLTEIEENEYNLNIPRYIDTFEPEPRLEIQEALKALESAEEEIRKAEITFHELLKNVRHDN